MKIIELLRFLRANNTPEGWFWLLVLVAFVAFVLYLGEFRSKPTPDIAKMRRNAELLHPAIPDADYGAAAEKRPGGEAVSDRE
jgi:hypothetical protein